MKKFLLVLSVIINLLYWFNVFADVGLRLAPLMNILFGLTFLVSILASIAFLIRSKQNTGYHPYLSISVLTLSLASLGWFSFINYLSLIMGT